MPALATRGEPSPLHHDDLPPPRRLPQGDAPLPAPLAGLLSAADARQRRGVLEECLAELGCDWLAVGALAPSPEGLRPIALCSACADPRSVRRYGARGWAQVDPRLARAAQSSLPVAWTLERLEREAAAAPQDAPLRGLVAGLEATGMRGGVMLVLPAQAEGVRHFMSLLARRPDPGLLAGDRVGDVLRLGMSLNEYCLRYACLGERGRAKVSLTPVQREILGHVVRGESDKRIAHHLCISSHAVDYHMRQLRSRFEVRNRVQLARVSRAMLGA